MKHDEDPDRGRPRVGASWSALPWWKDSRTRRSPRQSAAAALEHIHNGTEIDLALVDVRMPDLDGLELLRALKTDRPDMPVIMPVHLRQRAVRGAHSPTGPPPTEGRHAGGPLAGDRRGALGQWERPVTAGDPESLRGARIRGARPQRTSRRIQPHAASTTSSSSSPKGSQPRSRGASTCRRRPSRRTSPRSSASSASRTGRRPR